MIYTMINVSVHFNVSQGTKRLRCTNRAPMRKLQSSYVSFNRNLKCNPFIQVELTEHEDKVESDSPDSSIVRREQQETPEGNSHWCKTRRELRGKGSGGEQCKFSEQDLGKQHNT